ncbi:MAG: VOC family protein [Candidatus Binataceae bacterium]
MRRGRRWRCESRLSFCVPWDANGSVARDHQRHWTPVHLDFVVDDFDAAVERAVNAGAKLDRPVVRRPDRGDMANLSDPSGNGFDLIQRTARHDREQVTLNTGANSPQRTSTK